jgi:thiol:disulfide interchange protein
MRFQILLVGVLLIGFSFVCQANMGTAEAQVLAPSNQKAPAEKKPYQVTSRIHIQSGTNRGYLIVQVDLAKGNYIYSLSQKGDIPPSKVKVADSTQFKLLGKFSPDRPAAVTEKDPVMQQRVEKHKNKVQFFAPIELANGLDATKVVAKVGFDGQVCSENGFCMPVKGLTLQGKFSGYFQRSGAQQAKAAGASAGGSIIR